MTACIFAGNPVGASNPYGPPDANWYRFPDNTIAAFTTVYFYDSSTGFPTSWEWRFDSPTGTIFATTQNASYYFTADGVYIICLVAINAYGSDVFVNAVIVDST